MDLCRVCKGYRAEGKKRLRDLGLERVFNLPPNLNPKTIEATWASLLLCIL